MKLKNILLAFIALCPLFAQAAQKPNIVFILTDDHRYDAFSFMDHPVVETPHLDELRAEGIHFANAFVPTSICSPSRATILTSTYAHEHGVIDHSEREINFDRQTTFAAELQGAGYHTALIGKWHMHDDPGPRPGFDHWISFSGQGIYNNPPLNINGRNIKAEGYMTDLLNDYALDYIRERAAAKKPFMLYLSHKAMHGPFTPPERHRDLYKGRELPEPENWEIDYADKPEWQRFPRGGRVVRTSRDIADLPEPRPWSQRNSYMKKVIPNYLRTANAVDEGVGAIMDELERLGQLDNTLIIYMGDNGFFLGEHRLLDKRYAYEESIRVPIIARYPKTFAPGSTSEAMALNLDIGPTILDAANLAQPEQFKGRSLLQLADEAPADWRDRYIYSYWQEYMPNIPTMLAIRGERYKWVTYPMLNDIPELYDLVKDPHEMDNLALDPEYANIAEQMQTALDAEAARIGYTYEVPDPNVRFTEWSDKEGLLFSFDGRDPGAADIVQDIQFRNGTAEFKGHSKIRYPETREVNPIHLPYTVKARFKATADGTVLTHGDEHAGYGIVVENGTVAGIVTKEQSVYILETEDEILDEWVEVELAFGWTYTTLSINGIEVVEWPIRAPFVEPVKGPLVLGYNRIHFSKRFGIQEDWPMFKGAIDSVEIER